LTVYVVDAVRAEVPPVAVIVLDPPVVSETTSPPEARVHVPALVPEVTVAVIVDPVVQTKVPNEPAVNAVVDPVTDSAEPKPVTVIVDAIDCSGNPKLLTPVVALNVTLGVIDNAVVTGVVPSVTTMDCAPPGRAGTVTVTLKLPAADVVRQAFPPPTVPV
jgi:hypothetical protein